MQLFMSHERFMFNVLLYNIQVNFSTFYTEQMALPISLNDDRI